MTAIIVENHYEALAAQANLDPDQAVNAECCQTNGWRWQDTDDEVPEDLQITECTWCGQYIHTGCHAEHETDCYTERDNLSYLNRLWNQ